MSDVIREATGLYTTSEVEQRTGVPATTLRQWERRYGMPRPVRSQNGYRMYSAADLARIEFLQARLGEGITISRAVELCRSHFETPVHTPPDPGSEQNFKLELRTALLEPDHSRAAEILSRAHARMTVEDVLMRVMQPTLVSIGEMWARGEISVAREHVATAFLRGRVAQLLEMAGTDTWGPTVVAACGPAEQHEIGLLMLSVVLRRQGIRVHYLGTNTPLRDLALYALEVQADAALLSVNVPEALDALRAQRHVLCDMHVPVFFGGAQFNAHPGLADEFGGEFLGHDAVLAARQLHVRLKESYADPT